MTSDTCGAAVFDGSIQCPPRHKNNCDNITADEFDLRGSTVGNARN